MGPVRTGGEKRITMSDKDRLETIIDYLKQNGAALSTLDRRMDALNTDMRIVCESMKSVVERQAELEHGSANRRDNCAEVMDSLKERLTALEHLMTPIPEPFDPGYFEEETGEKITVYGSAARALHHKEATAILKERFLAFERFEQVMMVPIRKPPTLDILKDAKDFVVLKIVDKGENSGKTLHIFVDDKAEPPEPDEPDEKGYGGN